MNKQTAAPILLATAGLLLSPTPLAHADEPGACVDAGNTVEYCDQHYLNSVTSTGLSIDPGRAITVGHNWATRFANHPNKKEFSLLVNQLIQDAAAGKCVNDPDHQCGTQTISVDQAVFLVQMMVRFYGPPGLEDTMNSVMTAP